MFSPPAYSSPSSFIAPSLGPWSVFLWLHRQPILTSIKKAAPFLKGKLLDVGCGNKPYQELLDVTQYYGIDVTTSPHTKQQFDSFFDGQNIPFDDNSFDSVLCTEVLEHAIDEKKLMSEIIRVLKPGGYAFVTAPMFINHHEQPFDFRRLTFYGMKNLAESNEAEVIFIDHRGGYVEVLIAALYLAIGQRISKRPFSDILYWLLFPFIFLFLKLSRNRISEAQVVSVGWQMLIRK